MFGDADPFSDFFHTFFGGGEGPSAGSSGRGRGRTGRRARGATSSRRSSCRSKMPSAARRAAFRSSTTAKRATWTSVFRPASATVRASGSPARANTGHGREGRRSLSPYSSRAASRVRTQGQDLYEHVGVPLTTAVLGGEAEVQTLAAKHCASRFRRRPRTVRSFGSRGTACRRSASRTRLGDLYATVDVQLPKELTPEQRTHFEALLESWTLNASSAA